MGKPKTKKGAEKPPVRRFNQIQHKAARKVRSHGVRTLLGRKNYGDLEVCLRSYYVDAVMNRQEAVEENIRRENGLADDDKLSGAQNIEVSTETVLMALTGACGEIQAAPEVVDISERAGVEVIEDDVLVFDWETPPEAVYAAFKAMMDEDMLITMTKASKAIARLSDKEVVDLGKDSTFGLASDLAWQV